MTPEELKQAYYQLALAEIDMRASLQKRGKPTNTAKWKELAELICLKDYTLYKATYELGMTRTAVVRQNYRFVRCRTAVETRQGNLSLRSYTREEKLKVLKMLEKHSYAEVRKKLGVSYPTLQKWKLQQAAEMLS